MKKRKLRKSIRKVWEFILFIQFVLLASVNDFESVTLFLLAGVIFFVQVYLFYKYSGIDWEKWEAGQYE